ncbi:MAG: [LysW]-aminoadipate kinase [Herpetosiphon sp.]
MFVIKMGGAAGLDDQAVCADIAAAWHAGRRMVVVHGGSAETDALAGRLDHPARMITSPSGHTSRFTDRTTLEIFAMATAKINRLLVERLQGLNVNALGLSGMDGRVLVARRKEAVRAVENGKVRLLRDDWTGSIEGANGSLLRTLLDGGYLPVIAPIAVSQRGEMLNVDGDRAAAAIAAAVGADTLLLLTNVPGLLRRFPDAETLISRLQADDLPLAAEVAKGRMKKKIMGAGEALQSGVGRVIIGDGRRATPVTDALAGQGTVITGTACLTHGRKDGGVATGVQEVSE